MQCSICKYEDVCKSRTDEPMLSGCTSGHPMEFINQRSGRSIHPNEIEKEKEELIGLLSEIECEAMLLIERVKKAKMELPAVQTKEDAEKYETENEIDVGFKHIAVFN